MQQPAAAAAGSAGQTHLWHLLIPAQCSRCDVNTTSCQIDHSEANCWVATLQTRKHITKGYCAISKMAPLPIMGTMMACQLRGVQLPCELLAAVALTLRNDDMPEEITLSAVINGSTHELVGASSM
jgi:hypothetical protein